MIGAAQLAEIRVGTPAMFPTDATAGESFEPWRTGFLKQPVVGPIWLGRLNLQGDGQADLEHHGGVHKAVCAYSAEHYPFWRDVLHLPEMEFGAFGENFTITDLTEEDVCIGDVWTVGEAIIQVSQPRQPCWKLARRWNIKDLAAQVIHTGRTGWYFRVLEEGHVETGMPLKLAERQHPLWTISEANRVMHHDKSNRADAARLADIPALSISWRETLMKRVQS